MPRQARSISSDSQSSSPSSSATSTTPSRPPHATQTRSPASPTRQSSISPLHDLLSKLERNPELVQKLLREVEEREKEGGPSGESPERGSDAEVSVEGRVRLSRQRSEEETREKRRSRTKVGSQDEPVSYTYPPIPAARHVADEGFRERDLEAGKRARRDYEDSSSTAEEEGSDQDNGSLLPRRRLSGFERGSRKWRSRTKVGQGPGQSNRSFLRFRICDLKLNGRVAKTVSTMRQFAENASNLIRGRSPNHRPRPSLSSSASPSRSPSRSDSLSSPLPFDLYNEYDPYSNPDPHLRPFHKPSIDVDFHFPSFDKTGLPLIRKNKFLPPRLQSHTHATHLDARHREIREEGEHWRPRRTRAIGRGRAGESESDGGGPCFPCLLAMVLVVLPIALLALILGIVFRVARVDA